MDERIDPEVLERVQPRAHDEWPLAMLKAAERALEQEMARAGLSRG